jgi:ornithine cyclodeaminase
MKRIKVLLEPSLRKLLPLDTNAVQCIEDAFLALATKDVAMPPIMRIDLAEFRGEVDIKAAYQPGLESLAVKVASGFFNNPAIGLSSNNGLMILISPKTGVIQALLLDNGYLTDLRTAAAGAVAAKHLARDNASVATILGAGAQARLQLEALRLVRPIQGARIWARDPAKAERLVSELAKDLPFPVTAYADAREAVRGSDIIVTTTPAHDPILWNDWLEPGQHITAMGSDAEDKNEIDPVIVARADIYVADDLKQTTVLGELHHAIAKGLIDKSKPLAELGQVIAGQRPGRTDASQITMADLTGTGIQDTAIASLAFQLVPDQDTMIIES